MNKSFLSKWMTVSSVIIAILAITASLLGLFTSSPYALETENWTLQAQGQDIGNLIAALVLLVGTALARKGSLRAFLVWLGTLFYFIYAYVVYAMAVHFNSLFLVYVAVLGLAFYSVAATLLRNQNRLRVKAKEGRKIASYTLIATGALFAMLWLSEVIPATISGVLPKSLVEAGLWVNPIHVIDLSVVLPAFILTGLLALKSRRLGLVFLAPWLTFSVLMGASIVAAMALMIAAGFTESIPPMIMVSLVVTASLLALIAHLRRLRSA